MNFRIYSLLFLLIFSSCQSDDPVDCSVIDIAEQTFYIGLQNEQGENLLLNGTYNPEEIEITANNGDVNFRIITEDEAAYIALNEAILFRLNSEYEIHLSPEVTDIMEIEFSREQGICGTSIYTATKLTYNGEEQTIEEFRSNQKVMIIK